MPYEVREEAENLKNNKYVNLARNKYHEFVPLVAESFGGLGKAAIKLFAEIARSQASSRHPVGHIMRRLIYISQIAVQRQLSKTAACGAYVSLFTRRPVQ